MVSDAGGQAAATASMDQSSFAHMERLLRDETRGEYTVGKMLGRGGMAVVYLAEETRLGRKVALKVLPPELTFGHGVDRFLREAKTAATLDHPHIIPIYRIASGGKLFWYAMKYLEGRSLEDVLRERGTYSVEETIEILDQVADALDYAHEHQVIHRDIKPANVMLDGRNRVIITDFGIAKALSEGALTASGSVIGTPYFMSPEQGMGKPVDGRADQYSVGVMAFRMLAGRIPFDGDSAIDILHKHCMMAPPRLEEFAPQIPKHIGDAVEKALAKKADERFVNIRAFVKALKDPNTTYTRPSARTVVLTSDELAKVNSGPQAKIAVKGGAPADRTVVASPPKGSKAAPAKPAPKAEEKSKAPMLAVIALLVLGGGGFAAWKMMGSGSDAAPASVVAEAPVVTAAPAAAEPASEPVVEAPVEEPPPAAPVAATPQKSATTTPSAPVRQPPQRETAARQSTQTATQQAAPQQTAPAPVTAAPSAAAPVAAAAPTDAAATEGLLRLRLSTPANVSINGVNKGERTTLQESLKPGDHLLRVERDGFITKEQVVTIRAGQPTTLTITLEPKP